MAFFISFNLVLTKLQDAFYRFLKFKKSFWDIAGQIGGYNTFLMEGAN